MASVNTYIVVDKLILNQDPQYFKDSLGVDVVESDATVRYSLDGNKYFVKTKHNTDVDENTLPAGAYVVSYESLLETLSGPDWQTPGEE